MSRRRRSMVLSPHRLQKSAKYTSGAPHGGIVGNQLAHVAGHAALIGLGRPFKRLPGLLVQVDVQRPAFLHCSSPKQKGAPRAKRETLPICDTYAILLEMSSTLWGYAGIGCRGL